MKLPLFSIITVCFNAEKTIKSTLECLINQTCDDYEIVIIDGRSTDNTVNIIKEYSSYIRYWVSEEDNGIYDAMNKGIKAARGEWIAFLNADDVYSNKNVLNLVRNTIKRNDGIEFVYGKAAVYDNDKFLYEAGSLISDKDYWYPTRFMCHQSIFCKKNIFEKVGYFDTSIKGGISDYIWLVNYFRSKHGKVLFIDEVVANYSMGGYYEQHVWEAFMAQLKFANNNFLFSIRLKLYRMIPMIFIKIKILKLNKDTVFRRFYRNIKYSILLKR